MKRWIKGSQAKKEYGIPDRVYRSLCHGKNAIAFRPMITTGHWYFERGELEAELRRREIRHDY